MSHKHESEGERLKLYVDVDKLRAQKPAKSSLAVDKSRAPQPGKPRPVDDSSLVGQHAQPCLVGNESRIEATRRAAPRG